MKEYNELIKYINLYTDIKITVDWNKVTVDWVILNKSSDFIRLTIFTKAIQYLLINAELTSVKVFYLNDLITSLLREVAKLNYIDIKKYWWTVELLNKKPMLWVLYNIVESAKIFIWAIASWSATAEKMDFPLKEIIDELDSILDSYKPSKISNTAESSWDDSVTIKSLNDIF